MRFRSLFLFLAALVVAAGPLFALALKLAAGFTPLSATEVEAIKAKGLAAAPLFRYPSKEA